MSSTRESPLVLVVDGDRAFQRSLASRLRRSGLETLSLLHTRRAPDVAAEEQPDLVLVDVRLGYDRGNLIEALKNDPKTAHIPLLMYGKKESHYDKLLAFELGADDFFIMPDEPAELLDRILWHIRERTDLTLDGMRSPAETVPDLFEIDRQQLELLKAAEQKLDLSPWRSAANATPGPVLIVEDDQDIRSSLSHILEEEGIPTLTASNGQEALDLMRYRGVAPAVVLLDLMMPVMDGWEFRRRVENDASLPTPKFVIMSALSPDERMDVAAWLRKPLGVEQLLSTVTGLACA